MNLYDFQCKGLKETEAYDRCAYYWEMGLGKTFVGSVKLCSFNNPVNLVVCQKSKVSDWIEHFATNHSDLSVFDLTNKKSLASFISCKAHKVGVINYDQLFRRSELKTLKDFAIVFDESSMLKNEQAKRTKCALELNFKQVVLLSGTPVGGKYEELWSQCKLLGWNISKADFWNLFIKYKEWQPVPYATPIKLVIGYKDVDLLKSQLKRHGANFLSAKGVLDLPDQVFQAIKVKTSKEYKQLMEDGITTVDGVELVADMPLKKLLYARQICSVYSADKLKAFEDLINSNNDRLIVFYNFTAELKALKAVVGENRPISVVNGAYKDLTAYDSSDNSITFVQYQAGAMGLNLQKANRIVYYSLPLSSELFEQSKKRTHRMGQKCTCFYYYLLCSGSVEEKILSTLNTRNDFTLDLFR